MFSCSWRSSLPALSAEGFIAGPIRTIRRLPRYSTGVQRMGKGAGGHQQDASSVKRRTAPSSYRPLIPVLDRKIACTRIGPVVCIEQCSKQKSPARRSEWCDVKKEEEAGRGRIRDAFIRFSMDCPCGLSDISAAARDGLHAIWGDHQSNSCGDATRCPSTTKRRGNSGGIEKHFYKRAI